MAAPSTRHVRLIGGLSVEPTSRLTVPARRLLVFLALRSGPVPRWVVAEALWGGQPERQARASLRRAIWHLGEEWLALDGDALSVTAAVDVTAARVAAELALRGEALPRESVALLTTDILPGWNDEWLIPFQEEFHDLRVRALEIACRTLVQRGDLPLATQAGTAAVAAEPLRESAVEAVVISHLAEGNRYEAVRCYRSLARLLRTELGVRPNDGLTERLVHVGLPVDVS
jgi:DNA-binding SARP family transcriptional activator